MIKRLLVLIAAFLLTCTGALAQGSFTLPLGGPINPGDLADSAANYLIVGTYTGTKLQNYRTISFGTGLSAIDNGPKNSYQINLSSGLQYLSGLNITTQQIFVNQALNFGGLTTGDIIYYNGTNWTRLGIGGTGQILSVVAGLPSWQPNGSGAPSNAQYIVAVSNGSLTAAEVLTAGSGIGLTPVANTSMTVAVDATVIRTTGAQSMAGPKTLSGGPIISGANSTGLALAGTSFTDTILITDPGAARTYTIPDTGASGNFLMSNGAQTITGAKTFNSTDLVASNIVSGGSTLTLPSGTTDTLVARTTTDTLTNKTLTNPIFNTASTLTWDQTTANYTIQTANPSGARTYTIPDTGTTSNFMLNNAGTVSAGGIAYGISANLYGTSAAGSTGQAFISGGTGAPTVGALPIVGGGTNNGALSVTLGTVYYGDGTKINSVAPGASGNVLTCQGSAAPVWSSAGTGNITGGGTSGQMAVFTGSTSIGGLSQIIGAGGTLSLGTNGVSAGTIALNGIVGGQCVITSGITTSTANIILPAANLTLPAGNSVGALTNDGSGTCAWTRAGPGFGGDGDAGAIAYSTNQTPTGPLQLNATTITMSSTATYVPSAGPIIWNATGAVLIGASNTITIDGLGAGGGAAMTATTNGGSGAGMGAATGGYAGGSSGSATSAGSGGGYGGAGGQGGASATNAKFSGGSSYPFSLTGGSGGSAGGMGTNTAGGGAGGPGGGTFVINAVGNITVHGTISNKGNPGGAGTLNTCPGGGGSGGSIGLNSQGQIVIDGIINCTGGAGASQTTNGAGGGGAGRILGVSTSAASITGTITTTGGAAGTGTNAGTAGGASTAVWATFTPNLPLLGWLYGESHGAAKVFDFADEKAKRMIAQGADLSRGIFMDTLETKHLIRDNVDFVEYVKICSETALESDDPVTVLEVGDTVDMGWAA